MEKELVELQRSQSTIEIAVRALIVNSQETLERALDFTKEIIGLKKRAKEEKDFYVKPLKAHIKDIDNRWNPIISKIEEVEKILRKDKIEPYQISVVAEAKRQEEKLRQEQIKKFERETAKAEKKGVVPPPPPAPVKIEVPKVAGLNMKEIPAYEIEDETKIPKEYWKVDEVKIGKAVRAGIKDIPGVRIFKKMTSAISSADEEI